jgi:hypothetical protein
MLVPVLDHAVVNTRLRMGEAAETYRRLGFTLTPRGEHSLGSINHLAVFATDYLELIGLREGGARRDLLDWPEGLNGLVWTTEDAAATEAALVAAAVPHQPPQHFTRPVTFDGRTEDAAFTTVRLAPDTTPAGRLYFCQHFTRHLVWRDEWRHHANGATAIARAVLAAEDPGRLGALLSRLFGPALRPIAGGFRLAVGLARFDILTPAAVQAEFGAAVPPDPRPESMAALVLRTASLDASAAAIAAPGITRDASRLLVPAAAAFGVALAFEEG